ncbi:MAG: FxsA family protein [Sandaracinaceae bacterium]|nr:FxsA family protein [Sandaracinaceae bacterium]
MLAKLFLGFAVVTLLETYLLYVIGAWMGPWWTLALIVASAALGAFLTKREGLKILRAWRDSLGAGELPEEGVLGGVLVLVGAVLLVTPGVLTDLTGVVLLVPPSRRFVAKHLGAYLEKRFSLGPPAVTRRVRVQHADGTTSERVETHFGGGFARSRDPNVIDTEGEVVELRRKSDGPGARAELE